ncbi:MAG: cell division protein FtsL [Proteobacteria bacterium]|nr:MAG: cell division protein FtsL [Pseudomonadota bacterium]
MNRWHMGSLIVLYISIVAMAIMVASNRHHARQLFIELQQLEKKQVQLNSSWSELVLEHSTRLNQGHVERRASKKLDMQKPTAENIRVIRE